MATSVQTVIFFLHVLLFYFPIEQVIRVEQKQVSRSLSGRTADVANIDKRAIRVDIPDIVSVSACADLTLPPGAGLCIDTTRGPVFLVSIILFNFILKFSS